MRAFQDQQVASDTVTPPTAHTDSSGRPIGILMDGTKGARVFVRAVEGRTIASLAAVCWIWNPTLAAWFEAQNMYVTAAGGYNTRGTVLDVSYEVGNGNQLYVNVECTLSGTATVPAEQDNLIVRIEANDPQA